MHILLVEPYFGGSHRAWAEGYQRTSAHDVEVVSLPARWWKWRMRGGFITLAERCADLAASGYQPDVLLVTDMLDVAGFKGVLPRRWGSIPTAVYFHESQLTYPDSPQMEPDLSYAFTNWTTALAADAVIFNSEYHRGVFFAELPRLLRHFPDHRHEHLIGGVSEKTTVVPVGVDLSWVDPSPRAEPPLVMWNHRWEHDKDPETFVEAITLLDSEGVEFRLALCGERFANDDGPFGVLPALMGDRLIQFGHAQVGRYRDLLNLSDVVVSTARQEFFGVAVVEAMAAGACPVLPNRLSYPGLIPAQLHDQVLFEDGDLLDTLRSRLVDCTVRQGVSTEMAAHVRRFDAHRVSSRLDGTLESLA